MVSKRPRDLRRLLAERPPKSKPVDPVADAERETGPERDADADVTKPAATGLELPAAAEAAAAGATAGAADLSGRLTAAPQASVDPFDAAQGALDAKAGRIGEERERLRDEAAHGLQDDAARDDGVTGIAEQGRDAASAEFSDLFSKEGRVRIMKDLFGGDREGTAGARPGEDGVERTASDIDLSAVSTDNLENADLILSNLRKGDEFSKEVVRVTPGGTVIEQTPGGTTFFSEKDGKVVELRADGTRKVTRPDGSTTTRHPNGDVTDTPPTAPSAEQPDDENAFDLDPETAEFLGLNRFLDKIAPRPVEGGGHTDPVDDDPGFGAGVAGGSGEAIPDTKDLLLGGDTRGLDLAGGSGGSIDLDRALDPIGRGGAIDPTDDADPGFGAGGLEDDPLAGVGQPTADLSQRPDNTVDADEAAGSESDGEGGEGGEEDAFSFADAIGAPVLADSPVPAIDLGVAPTLAAEGESGDDGDLEDA